MATTKEIAERLAQYDKEGAEDFAAAYEKLFMMAGMFRFAKGQSVCPFILGRLGAVTAAFARVASREMCVQVAKEYSAIAKEAQDFRITAICDAGIKLAFFTARIFRGDTDQWDATTLHETIHFAETKFPEKDLLGLTND